MSRGGGTVVAAAVAVLEKQQNLQENGRERLIRPSPIKNVGVISDSGSYSSYDHHNNPPSNKTPPASAARHQNGASKHSRSSQQQLQQPRGNEGAKPIIHNLVNLDTSEASAFTQIETRKRSQPNTLNTTAKNNQCLGDSKADSDVSPTNFAPAASDSTTTESLKFLDSGKLLSESSGREKAEKNYLQEDSCRDKSEVIGCQQIENLQRGKNSLQQGKISLQQGKISLQQGKTNLQQEKHSLQQEIQNLQLEQTVQTSANWQKPSIIDFTSKNLLELTRHLDFTPSNPTSSVKTTQSTSKQSEVSSNARKKPPSQSFENAVKDFDLIAEDVRKFVVSSAQNGASKSGKTESNGEECLVYKNRHRNQFVDGDKTNKNNTNGDGEGAVKETGKILDVKASDDYRESDSSTAEEDDSSSDSEGEKVLKNELETITEEDRLTASSVNSTGADSSSPEDDSTVKGNGNRWEEGLSNHDGSTSDVSNSSSSSSEDDNRNELKDSSSTRCNSDFQWIRKETTPKRPSPIKSEDSVSSLKMEEQLPQTKPPISRNSSGREQKPSRRSLERNAAPGSLDRRRPHHQNRHERDQKSRSTHMMKSPSPRLDDYLSQSCNNWCCNPFPNGEALCFENFHRRHERMDPQRYGSSPMLMEQQQRFMERGSHPDLYNDCNRFRHDPSPMGYFYHMPPPPPPPCCCFGDGRGGYHWTPPMIKGPDYDEKFRKLQNEKDNLQLQVQVLSEQIEAQTDKIADLEKNLQEKKQTLTSTEDLLQREMLSRSSLETQKLELMSAMSELKLQQAALERENLELRSSHMNNNSSDSIKKAGYISRMSPQPQLTSTPVHHSSNQTLRMSPSPSPVTTGGSISSPRRIESSTPLQQEIQPPKTPPANYRRRIELHFASLPRQQFLSNGGSSFSVVDSNANPANSSGNSSASGRRGVAFAETEKIIIDDATNNDHSQTLQFNKNKGIKKIFGKMKRSGSGNLEELPGVGEFQRGGVRATAAARLGWSEPQIVKKPDKPFIEWDTDNICDWLEDLGLDQYIQEAKRWAKSGQQLQEASMSEIEKELAIKNPLHKKKLQLALIDTQENSSSDPYLTMAGKLDTAWVLRWLDDTGLPQHKEAFLVNKIDGRVLHRLTMDDLAMLHVTSLLHVASLKRGIQVLRENNYEPGCLARRSLPEDPAQPIPKQISLWTTHRVMEWLRAVDLAEYAPNLRGAGVHGGLMVLENKFTAELLATLLSIPPGKTLLRRHLNTHFKELLGKEIIQAKREAEATLGYIPLTPSSKLKIPKKSHFSLKRNKSKGEADYGDLVCPMNSSQSGDQNGTAPNMGTMRIAEVKEEDACLLDNYSLSGSYPQSASNSPLLQRHED